MLHLMTKNEKDGELLSFVIEVAFKLRKSKNNVEPLVENNNIARGARILIAIKELSRVVNAAE